MERLSQGCWNVVAECFLRRPTNGANQPGTGDLLIEGMSKIDENDAADGCAGIVDEGGRFRTAMSVRSIVALMKTGLR